MSFQLGCARRTMFLRALVGFVVTAPLWFAEKYGECRGRTNLCELCMGVLLICCHRVSVASDWTTCGNGLFGSDGPHLSFWKSSGPNSFWVELVPIQCREEEGSYIHALAAGYCGIRPLCALVRGWIMPLSCHQPVWMRKFPWFFSFSRILPHLCLISTHRFSYDDPLPPFATYTLRLIELTSTETS